MRKKSLQVFGLFFGALASALNLYAAPGDLDPTFDPGSGLGGIAAVDAIAVQPDGRIIIGGRFANVRGLARPGLARLNADGSGDPTFDPGTATGPLGLFVVAIAVQTDGKVLIGGSFTSIHGFARRGIARLNSDGTVDDTFNVPDGVVGSVRSIVAQPDGKALVLSSSGGGSPRLVRLNSNGTPDSGFVPPQDLVAGGIDAFALQPDGKVAIAVNTSNVFKNIIRLNADGSRDKDFYLAAGVQGGSVKCLAVAADGKVVLAGSFAEVNSTARDYIARLNADGTLDKGFINTNFTTLNAISPIAVQPDGKVLLAGDVRWTENREPAGIVRLNPDGTLDESFLPKFDWHLGFNGFLSIWLQPDGKVLVVGSFDTIDGINRSRMARLNSDGSLDPSFNAISGIDFRVLGVRTQPDGKLLVAGSFAGVQGLIRYGIARLNINGTVDTNFNSSLLPYPPPANQDDRREYNVWGILFQPDGKVLAAFLDWSLGGSPDGSLNLARLDADGSVDQSFAPVRGPSLKFPLTGALALQTNGQVVIGGFFTGLNDVPRDGIARVNADGTLDLSFDVRLTSPTNNPYVRAIALQPDGKLLIGGRFDTVNGTNRAHVARLNADGTLDSSFNSTPGVEGAGISAVLLQPNGKVLVSGPFSAVNGVARNGIARLNADGTLDASFDPGSASVSHQIYAMALQPDGKVVIVFLSTENGVTSWGGLARLNTDGSVDRRFNSNVVPQILSLDLQPNGALVIGGTFAVVNGVARNYVARLFWSDGAIPVSAERRGDDFIARFLGIPGVTYTLESTASLSPPAWRKLTNQTAPTSDLGSGLGAFELRDPIGPENPRFYRTIYPAY